MSKYKGTRETQKLKIENKNFARVYISMNFELVAWDLSSVISWECCIAANRKDRSML